MFNTKFMYRLLHSFFVIYSYSLILYGLHLLSKLNFFPPFFFYLSCLVSALPISPSPVLSRSAIFYENGITSARVVKVTSLNHFSYLFSENIFPVSVACSLLSTRRKKSISFSRLCLLILQIKCLVIVHIHQR